jgi:hypothetical protein
MNVGREENKNKMIRFFIYLLLLYIGVKGQNLRGKTFLQPFYGIWYVSYTNIDFTSNPTNCIQYYMAQDDSLQFVYTFKKVQYYMKNPEYQSGTIHIDDLDNIHQWRLRPDNKNSDDFIQHILHIDESKRFMIISNNKKMKIYVLTRNKIQNEDEKMVNEIYDILHETLNMTISLYSVDNSLC